MSKKKNIITLSARPHDLFLLCEGSDDYVGIPCLKINVSFPSVIFTSETTNPNFQQTDPRVKSIKIGATDNHYFLMFQRNKFVITDSYNKVAEFASTNPVPLGRLIESDLSNEAKAEFIRGLIALAITNFSMTLNKSQYSECGLDFDFKGGFTYNNRGSMIDQFADAMMVYFDIFSNDGEDYPVEELKWYYANRGINVNDGTFTHVYILPKIAERMRISDPTMDDRMIHA